MARERDIERGKRVIKNLLRRRSGRNPRFHRGAAEENLHRLWALEGICGNCQDVKIKIFPKDGKKVTDVDCKAGHSPMDMYFKTSMGEDPDCPDFSPRR